MICPFCSEDITTAVASTLGKLGGPAAAAALTKKQRIAKAKRAGRANAGIPRPSPTGARSESCKAAWAKRKAAVFHD